MAGDGTQGGDGNEGKGAGQGGNNPKMVPESDLLAVKASLSKEVESAKQAAADAIAKLDEATKSVTTERAAREAVEKELVDIKEKVANHEATRSELEEVKKKLQDIETREVTAIQEQLKSAGIPEDEIKGKSRNELELMSKVLGYTKTSSGSGSGKGFDVRGGGGAGAVNLSPRDMIRAGIEGGELIKRSAKEVR
jgi:superfamily II RNA helicase